MWHWIQIFLVNILLKDLKKNIDNFDTDMQFHLICDAKF